MVRCFASSETRFAMDSGVTSTDDGTPSTARNWKSSCLSISSRITWKASPFWSRDRPLSCPAKEWPSAAPLDASVPVPVSVSMSVVEVVGVSVSTSAVVAAVAPSAAPLDASVPVPVPVSMSVVEVVGVSVSTSAVVAAVAPSTKQSASAGGSSEEEEEEEEEEDDDDDAEREEEEEAAAPVAPLVSLRGTCRSDGWPMDMTVLSVQSSAAVSSLVTWPALLVSSMPRNSAAREGWRSPSV